MAISIEGENMRREQDARRQSLDAARQNVALSTRQGQTGDASPDEEGYFDDATQTFISFFRFDVSAFGDGSVFR